MSEERTRPRRSLARRLAPIAVGILGAWVFGEFFLPKPVEVFVRVPENAPEFRMLDLRLVRADDGAQVLRTKRPHEVNARTVILGTKLKKGTYRVEAWPQIASGAPPRWEGTLEVKGDEAAEVEVRPAADIPPK